jgi:hypothetical protein
MAALMSMFDRPDNLVVKTHHDGTEAEVTPGDHRMVQLDPSGVTITRGLTNRFPDPADPEARERVEAIFEAHRESDGPLLRHLIDEFRLDFGWHPRVEWFDVLAREIANDPSLLEAQTQLIASYEALLKGETVEMVPLAEPLRPETLHWALGANHLNLMEWLWKHDQYESALGHYDDSLLGLSETDDNGRRIERLLIKASCHARLEQSDLGREAVRTAQTLDATEFERLWALYGPKMPELRHWTEKN